MKLLTAALTRMLAWLPLSAIRSLAAVIGGLIFRSGSDMARITKINLSNCFPELDGQAVEALARQSLSHTACLFVESGPLAHWSGERLRQLIVSETGRESLDARLASGGVLLLVPHFGNWEFICFALGHLEFVALYDPPRRRSLEKPLRRIRGRFGAHLHPANPGGIRIAYRHLRRGGLVCLLPDQVPQTSGGVYAPFFGSPALTATFAHRLIARTGTAVMLGSARRVKGGFSLAYESLGEEICAERPETFAGALNGAIEELVRRDPAQYQWEYKRFKRQPEAQLPFYPKR